ncbi:hypothetical protein HQ35_10155 [Porphyromonas cangingivalis]|uniref:Uncharacterized protein n=1 Tax=Porphyromonas cangingivalis TaxID=36874 RepID=A0A0A2EQB7_PORCN|nr:hypothetical protein HQ35_10155 [Porphyromonas cangingivalis]
MVSSARDIRFMDQEGVLISMPYCFFSRAKWVLSDRFMTFRKIASLPLQITKDVIKEKRL